MTINEVVKTEKRVREIIKQNDLSAKDELAVAGMCIVYQSARVDLLNELSESGKKRGF
jgi:hypothetical protein